MKLLIYILICGCIIQPSIVNETREAKFFTVKADETADVSNIEQLSISLRNLNFSSENIIERFLSFTKVNDITGDGIAKAILESLTKQC